MQLVNARDLSQITGLAYTTISNLKTRGVIKGQQQENGKYLFDVDQVKRDLEAVGVKPRGTRAADTQPEAKTSEGGATQKRERKARPAAAEVEETPDTETFFQAALKKAFLKSKRAYREFLLTVVKECEGNAQFAELELKILRHLVEVDSIFKGLRHDGA